MGDAAMGRSSTRIPGGTPVCIGGTPDDPDCDVHYHTCMRCGTYWLSSKWDDSHEGNGFDMAWRDEYELQDVESDRCADLWTDGS